MAVADTASPVPNGVHGIKRKHEGQPERQLPNFMTSASATAAKKTQPLDNAEAIILSHIQDTIQYLKSKRHTERTFEDITNFLSIQYSGDTALRKLRFWLLNGETRVIYNPTGLGGVGSFKYRPTIPVEEPDQLKAYLQRQKSSKGLKYDDLKDGWPDAAPVLDDMSLNGELLLNKDKKGNIKNIWQDDPTLHHTVALEFQISFGKIKLPTNAEDVRDALVAAGLKPTSAPRQVVKTQEKAKKKAPRKGGKTTNTHITHLLKDYSHKRK